MSRQCLDIAWGTRCANLGEKLVLLFLADQAGVDGRVRVDPVVMAPRIGLSVARVDAALAALTRSQVIESRRWDDTGAWSVTLIENESEERS